MATGIPISIFEGKALLHKGEHILQDYSIPLYIVSSLSDSLPAIWYSNTPEYLYFGGLDISRLQRTSGAGSPLLLLLGPVLVNPCTGKQAEAVMQRLGRRLSDAAAFRHCMDQSPLVSVSRLAANLILLSNILLNAPVSHVALADFTWAHIFPSPRVEPIEAMPSGADMENLEEMLLSMLRNGKVREMRIFFNESPIYHNPEADAFTKSVSTRRNFILGANGVASRAAISAGVDPSLINAISGNYIDEISKTSSLGELSTIFQRFMLDYTARVSKLMEFPFDGQLEKKVNRYVHSHIYEKLTSSILADALGFSAPYLSSAFKKATGMTVTDFIAQQKIKEARYLLDCHAYSIPEISQLLCFSSQSYFGCVFRKLTGMTPLEYQLRSRAFLPPL